MVPENQVNDESKLGNTNEMNINEISKEQNINSKNDNINVNENNEEIKMDQGS